jgi:hypothetical protein
MFGPKGLASKATSGERRKERTGRVANGRGKVTMLTPAIEPSSCRRILARVQTKSGFAVSLKCPHLAHMYHSPLFWQYHNLSLALTIQPKRMAPETTVLSLNPDRQKLMSQESILRDNGFEIISVATPPQARFEIQMGRCGIFMTSYVTPRAIYCDLVNLFRRSCPSGLVIFLRRHANDDVPDADVLLSDHDEPESIIHAIRSEQETNGVRLP